jgi:uncharacterized protein
MRRMTLWFSLALVLVAAWVIAGRLHRFAYWTGTKTPEQVAALATGGWQAVEVAVDGETLHGLVRPPQRATASWILFVPGNSAAILDGFQKVLDELRGDADVGLALFAYRGFDASTGTPSPPALDRDVAAMWRHLRERGIAAERIEIWGYSLGSILATRLAAALCTAGEGPRALRLLAASDEIRVMQHGLFGRFLPADVFEALPAAGAVRCPVTMLHGTADAALPIASSRRLAAAFQPAATLHELAGADHFNLWPHARRWLAP